MKIPKSVIQEDYEFWKLNRVEQVKVYTDYIMEYEIIDIPRYQKAPKGYVSQFHQYVDKIYTLFKERYDDKNHEDARGFDPFVIAFIIIYIASAVSHVGLTREELRKQMMLSDQNSLRKITDYLLNTIDCLDWFRQTLEYKEWEAHEKWKRENPNYYKKPDDPKEMGKIISLTQKKVHTYKFAQDKVLSKIKR